MLAIAYLAALLTSDVRLEGRAEARLETRARTATAADANTAAAGDAEVTPTLFGALDNLGGRISLLYAPTIRMREPYVPTSVDENGNQRGRRTEFNQRQVLDMQWAREGRPRLYLIETLYYGRSDLAVQRGALTSAPTPFQLGQVTEMNIDVGGGVLWPLTRLMSLDTSAGFNYGTGLDPRSVALLPSQRAWRSRARLETLLSPLDTLSGQFDFGYSIFPGLQTTQGIGSLAVRWRHQVVRSTAFELGLLGGMVYGSYVDQPAFVIPYPGGDAALLTRVSSGPHTLAFDVGVRVAPYIDRYVAAAFSRGELFTSFGYLYRDRWSIGGRAGVARSLTPVRMRAEGDPEEIFTAFGEVRAGYGAPRWWRVDLSGVNSTFVLGNGAPVNNWLVSLSLTLHAEGQR